MTYKFLEGPLGELEDDVNDYASLGWKLSNIVKADGLWFLAVMEKAE